ncbi:MAG: PAS domain S-box protein [Burkholderiales bacterium]|nr:PAS domain S-box protein [Burkholderiales bacterium]
MTADPLPSGSPDPQDALRRLRQAEEALRDSEARYRALFEMAAAGITRVSLDGRVLDANARACEILGRPREAVVGRLLRDFLHPDDQRTDGAGIDELLAGRLPRVSGERRYLRADGSTVWVQGSVTLLRDAHGRPDHLVAVLEDITERKRYVDAMIATQAAERANRAKSEFLSRMSHELRTPLNAMLGFAQLLRVDASQPLSATQRTKIEHIERAGAHLLSMISDVLDLSRIEAGGLPLSIEPLPIQAVLDDALNLSAAEARATHVQIRVEPLPADLCARADRVRLRQVLVNLLSNAIKYNLPGGQVLIRCRAEARNASAPGDEGSCIALSVADTGPGMSEQQQAHLFEPFNRLGAERSGIEGSGIGLVIVRRLLELMGGSIEVDSTVGRGSTFTVRVPAAQPVVQPAMPAAADAPLRAPAPPLPTSAARLLTDELPAAVGLAAEPPPGAGQGRALGQARVEGRAFTVLYAEDNEVNVELVRQVMRMRPGYRLIVAHSGAQAIELTRAELPDVLLLDMHLGDMTGLDVVTALERDAATAAIPRLALSADALPDQIRAARERGFLDYLTKPLDVGALLRCLDEQHDQAKGSG